MAGTVSRVAGEVGGRVGVLRPGRLLLPQDTPGGYGKPGFPYSCRGAYRRGLQPPGRLRVIVECPSARSCILDPASPGFAEITGSEAALPAPRNTRYAGVVMAAFVILLSPLPGTPGMPGW